MNNRERKDLNDRQISAIVDAHFGGRNAIDKQSAKELVQLVIDEVAEPKISNRQNFICNCTFPVREGKRCRACGCLLDY